MWLNRDSWRWSLGLICIAAVATIWIAASYIVKSVVDSGVSPFLITYICNSLFVVLIPIVEISRCLEDTLENSWYWFRSKSYSDRQQSGNLENVNLLVESCHDTGPLVIMSHSQREIVSVVNSRVEDSVSSNAFTEQEPYVISDECRKQVDVKGRWTRTRVAKVSLLICPFWFFAQLTFNLSLKYTTVTSNTILSSTSSLFTFLVALAFLGEKFTWVKLFSVLLCMGGTIIVSLTDSISGINAIVTKPLLGDILALISAGLYAIYITLIRKKLSDEKEGEGQASTAQFLGFLGLFNLLIFLPVSLMLDFTKLEPFHKLSWKQFGLIVGKGWLSICDHLMFLKAFVEVLVYDIIQRLRKALGRSPKRSGEARRGEARAPHSISRRRASKRRRLGARPSPAGRFGRAPGLNQARRTRLLAWFGRIRFSWFNRTN
ncbi:hypothetical protein GW17_00037326 [Ensete ventricosum]|nr:hypothetical protein GW17_00037326 [Ensete ventricosum]